MRKSRSRFLSSLLSVALVLCNLTFTVVAEAEGDTVTALTLDTEYTVSITDWGDEWFSFTPEEDGRYNFSSSDVAGDSFVYLYDAAGYSTYINEGMEEYIGYDDDSGSSLNFSLTCDLTAGETYYYRACTYNYEDEYTVVLVQTKIADTISVSALAQTEFYSTDYVSFSGTEISVTYEDGDTATFEFESYNVFDSYSGSNIRYNIYNESGEWVADVETTLEAGNYTVTFYEDDVYSNLLEFTVSDPPATALTLDEEKEVTGADTTEYYSFTPDEEGTYIISIYDISSCDTLSTCVTSNGENFGDYWCSAVDDETISMRTYMEAGRTYYIPVYPDTDGAGYTVLVAQPKTIESISIVDGSMTDSFTMGDTIAFDGTKLNITYTDGSTSEFTLEYNWQEDAASISYVYYAIYYTNGDEVYTSELPAGSYYVKFYAGDDASASAEFTVMESDSVIELTLDEETEYANDIEEFCEDFAWFSYTPDEDGTYLFSLSNVEYYWMYIVVYIYSPDGLQNEEWYWIGADDLYICCDFEAGNTYYIGVSGYTYTSIETGYTVKVAEALEVTSIALAYESTLATEFDFGDYVSFEGTELILKYEDGTSADVTLNSNYQTDTLSGEDIYYEIYNEDNDLVSTGGTVLMPGTYSVNFYEGDVSTGAYEFTVNDSDDIIELELDESYTGSFSWDENVWYSYTPEVTGRYAFKVSDVDSDWMEISLYDDYSNQIGWTYACTGEDNQIECMLTEGVTYYYEVYGYGDTNSYNLDFYQTLSITDISVSNMETEFTIEDIPSFEETVLTISYSDDSTLEFTLEYNWQEEPTLGECIYYYICDENGEWVSDGDQVLSDGTYYVVFGCDDIESSQYEFTVTKVEQIVDATADYSSVEYGETAQITVDSEGTGDVTYTSSDTSVATVDSTGLVTTTGAGTVTITVTVAEDDYYAEASTTVDITVVKADQTVTATAASSSIEYGETTQITASQAGTGAISYSSSDTSVATVDSTGLVTATGVGTATITVTVATDTNYNTASTTVDITVVKADQTVTATAASSSIEYGETTQITASQAGTGAISYSSSDTSVATVDSTGLVTATGVGTATITVTVATDTNYNTASTTVVITVVKADQTVTATAAGSSIEYGETTQITASQAGTGAISYSSSDTSVATVDDTGLVTATGVGTATITVTVATDTNYNTASTTVVITVTEASISYLLGDVNQDGDIDYLDAMTVLRYDAELITIDEAQFLAGDVNLDGYVDSLDAILILRYDADLIDSF